MTTIVVTGVSPPNETRSVKVPETFILDQLRDESGDPLQPGKKG